MIRMDTFPYCLWEHQRESAVMRSVCVMNVSLISLQCAEKMSWLYGVHMEQNAKSFSSEC